MIGTSFGFRVLSMNRVKRTHRSNKQKQKQQRPRVELIVVVGRIRLFCDCSQAVRATLDKPHCIEKRFGEQCLRQCDLANTDFFRSRGRARNKKAIQGRSSSSPLTSTCCPRGLQRFHKERVRFADLCTDTIELIFREALDSAFNGTATQWLIEADTLK